VKFMEGSGFEEEEDEDGI